MAWCENPNCRKDGLRKADVEFDEDHKKVLCHGCYALHHPGWLPPAELVDCSVPDPATAKPPITYEFSLTNTEGFKAKVVYGNTVLAFHAPMELLEKWMG